MTSPKFPNTPKPSFGSFSDGFPKPHKGSGSEFSEVICFNEPLLACQSNDLVNEQTPVQVSQTIQNRKFRPAPAQIFAVFQPSSVMHDPWSETEEPVSQSLPDNCDMSVQGPSIPNRPTLMKVGEDPYDPWNPCVSVEVPHDVNQSIPRFGHDLGRKQTGCFSNTKPLHTPVLSKLGEDPYDQIQGCLNLEHQTLQTKRPLHIHIRVDPRNAL